MADSSSKFMTGLLGVAVLVAIGVRADGYREILGVMEGAKEDTESWRNFQRHLKQRGLAGVKLVVSDAHMGLKAAARKVLKTEWQRCKVHFYRNVLVHAHVVGYSYDV